jgi:hypothetical protein
VIGYIVGCLVDAVAVVGAILAMFLFQCITSGAVS